MWEYAKPAVAIVVWYFFNISVVISNKYLFQILNFKFPITLTLVHMLTCSAAAFLTLRVFKILPYKVLSNESWKRKVLPLSMLYVFNIVLGNISLRYVPVSFMQTIKSGVPAFTCLLQYFIFKTKFSREVIGSLVLVVGGVALTSLTEVNFDMIGFSSALLSSVTTAAQTLLTGALLAGDDSLDAVNLLYYMSPPSALILLPLSAMYELSAVFETWEFAYTYFGCVALVMSGLCAFGLNLSQFICISVTSPLTATVAGNFKVVLATIISVMIFKNQITFMNGVGCAIAVVGVYLFNMIKFNENQRKKMANQGK